MFFASQFDWPCTVPAIAPHPLLILNGQEDPRCPLDGLKLTESRSRDSYRKVNAIENLKEPLGSATVDSCIRVVDNGRESHHRNAWSYQFRGSARWIHSLNDAALNPGKNLMAAFPSMIVSKRKVNKRSIDWTAASSTHVNSMTSDVIAPLLWKIFGCQNGLHLFKEPKDRDSNGRGVPKFMQMLQEEHVFYIKNLVLTTNTMKLKTSNSGYKMVFTSRINGVEVFYPNFPRNVFDFKLYDDLSTGRLWKKIY
ncbi:hypothetical protein OROHE_010896 [Orobanche hederae]